MTTHAPVWPNPQALIADIAPDHPAICIAPTRLRARAEKFLTEFPGLVSYAVKANPETMVLMHLIEAGVTAFDVASPTEIDTVRKLRPSAALHYHNPVKSSDEIRFALKAGVRSFAADCAEEVAKIQGASSGAALEVSVRFRLPDPGGAYDFGSKFGATPWQAAALLRMVSECGMTPSLTFHPGTQCLDRAAYPRHIAAAAEIAQEAGVKIARLNVGGGFPVSRTEESPALSAFFTSIRQAVKRAFGAENPELVSEPGRAMVAECCDLVTRVKLVRGDGAVFLNDGVYGGLSEALTFETVNAFTVIGAGGRRLSGETRNAEVFGPTCDSIDKLPEPLALPRDLAEGDFVVFRNLGAYGSALSTAFNGYGAERYYAVNDLS